MSQTAAVVVLLGIALGAIFQWAKTVRKLWIAEDELAELKKGADDVRERD